MPPALRSVPSVLPNGPRYSARRGLATNLGQSPMAAGLLGWAARSIATTVWKRSARSVLKDPNGFEALMDKNTGDGLVTPS
jgi:hypothetical protein